MWPGVRTAPKEKSLLNIQPLHQGDCRNAIDTLIVIFQSSFGPQGKLKSIHNNTGGHVTLTSSAGRILQTVTISTPLVRLVTTAIQGHLNVYSDGGLFTGLVSLNLIKNGLATGIHQRLVIEVNELLLKESLEYLKCSQCTCRVDIDTTHVDGLLRLIASVLASKPGCQLSESDRAQLSRLLLEGIVKSTSTTSLPSSGNLQYVCIEGRPPCKSHLIQGILLEAPQYPTYRRQPLNIKPPLKSDDIRVALVSTSMSGDSEDFLCGQYEVQDETSVLSQAVLCKMAVFVQSLVQLGVGILLCQKVVHPRVKRQLKEAGVVTLDRLGLSGITVAQALAGGSLVSSWLMGVCEDDLGRLSSITLKEVGGRNYIHLEAAQSASPSSRIVTLVLCNRSEEALDELKKSCSVAQEVVHLTMAVPWALRGAGLWQAHLAEHLHKQVNIMKKQWSSKLGCSEVQTLNISNVYIETLAQIDVATKNIKPRTGLGMFAKEVISTIQREPSDSGLDQKLADLSSNIISGLEDDSADVSLDPSMNTSSAVSDTYVNVGESTDGREALDCYEAYVNALKTGVGTANMILGIHTFVQDVN